MRVLLSLLLLSAAVMPAVGEDVPFAERTPSTASRQGSSHSSTLGQLMELLQSHHIKLWYAGQGSNKDLELYTLSRMVDTFSNAAMLYQNIPVEYLVALDQPMRDLRRAVDDRNADAFVKGYSDLTVACNACHNAASIGFVVIKKPTSSPFSNQDFAVVKK